MAVGNPRGFQQTHWPTHKKPPENHGLRSGGEQGKLRERKEVSSARERRRRIRTRSKLVASHLSKGEEAIQLTTVVGKSEGIKCSLSYESFDDLDITCQEFAVFCLSQ